MPTVQELYELWAGDSELREELGRSLGPRGLDSLYETFAALGPRPGDVLADVGARDARHAIRLMQQHELRAIAIDPVELHCDLARAAALEAGVDLDVVRGSAEELPLDDASVDWIWCRDVLPHVDVRRGLSEFARVLKPGGAAVAYVTLPTELLEAREAVELAGSCALAGFDAAALEAAARDAGLVQRSVDRLGSEWRERMLEDGTWDAKADLLALARLRRNSEALRAEHGDAAVDAALGGLLWGIYQLLGKLAPTVYVWERPHA